MNNEMPDLSGFSEQELIMMLADASRYEEDKWFCEGIRKELAKKGKPK